MKTGQHTVIHNMQVIENIFREVQDLFPELDESRQLVPKLKSYPVQFRSIAYEAASMCIALSDLKVGVELTRWADFLERYSASHTTQYHIGLGWALAQEQLNPSTLFRFSEDDLSLKVCDGYGYYEGFFRRRKSIANHEQPEFFDALTRRSYDQGLGRSIWYSSKADEQQAAKTINEFAENRKADLWTGLGIAIAYVGGCSQQMLEEISVLAGEYKSNLYKGARMALASREHAVSVTDDVLLTVKIFGE